MIVGYIVLSVIVLLIDLVFESAGMHSLVTVLLMIVLYNLHLIKDDLAEIKKQLKKNASTPQKADEENTEDT